MFGTSQKRNVLAEFKSACLGLCLCESTEKVEHIPTHSMKYICCKIVFQTWLRYILANYGKVRFIRWVVCLSVTLVYSGRSSWFLV